MYEPRHKTAFRGAVCASTKSLQCGSLRSKKNISVFTVIFMVSVYHNEKSKSNIKCMWQTIYEGKTRRYLVKHILCTRERLHTCRPNPPYPFAEVGTALYAGRRPPPTIITFIVQVSRPYSDSELPDCSGRDPVSPAPVRPAPEHLWRGCKRAPRPAESLLWRGRPRPT